MNWLCRAHFKNFVGVQMRNMANSFVNHHTKKSFPSSPSLPTGLFSGGVKSNPTYRRKTILHVSFQDPLHMTGGQWVVIWNLVKEQIKLGYKTVWVSLRIQGEKSEQYFLKRRLRVRRIKISDSDAITTPNEGNERKRFRRGREFGDQFVRLIQRHYRAEETYIHLHGFYGEAQRASQLKAMGYNVTSTYHVVLSARLATTKEDEPFLPRLKKLERKSILVNDKIILNAPGTREELRELAPDYAGHIYIIPNGVEDEFFELPKQKPDQKPLISAYGRIAPEKGFELLIDAAKILSERANFLIFGKNDFTERTRAQYYNFLKNKAEGIGCIQWDIRQAGVRGAEKISYVDRSSIGVIPSLYEPFGIVMLEYLSRGRPIITTLTQGAKYILGVQRTGRTPFGFVVDRNPRSVAKATQWLLDHPREARRMGQEGKRLAQHYRWANINEQTLAVYKSI